MTSRLDLNSTDAPLWSTGSGGRTPNPRWSGFHEIFHALTITAFTAHCIGIVVALRTTA
jgi:predicted membrane channel-forming protein YqfA (hemolysin III family)